MEKENTNTERGGISIELEHIFPIIKKWLYSEKEIFVREIVSNACDAITKLKRLVSLGETDTDVSDTRIKELKQLKQNVKEDEESIKKYLKQKE